MTLIILNDNIRDLLDVIITLKTKFIVILDGKHVYLNNAFGFVYLDCKNIIIKIPKNKSELEVKGT